MTRINKHQSLAILRHEPQRPLVAWVLGLSRFASMASTAGASELSWRNLMPLRSYHQVDTPTPPLRPINEPGDRICKTPTTSAPSQNCSVTRDVSTTMSLHAGVEQRREGGGQSCRWLLIGAVRPNRFRSTHPT